MRLRKLQVDLAARLHLEIQFIIVLLRRYSDNYDDDSGNKNCTVSGNDTDHANSHGHDNDNFNTNDSAIQHIWYTMYGRGFMRSDI